MAHVPREDAKLLQILDERMDVATRLAGERLACAPGCTACCIGPFPITRLDALRLADGLDALKAGDAERAARVAARARFTADLLRFDFPGNAETGVLDEDEDAVESYLSTHAVVPCPALDPEHGTCDLYDHRPVTCRTYGPPVHLGGEDLPPCRLCFVGAPQDEVDRCRVDPDPDGVEDDVLDRIPDGDDHTLVVFALLDGKRTSAANHTGRATPEATPRPATRGRAATEPGDP